MTRGTFHHTSTTNSFHYRQQASVDCQFTGWRRIGCGHNPGWRFPGWLRGPGRGAGTPPSRVGGGFGRMLVACGGLCCGPRPSLVLSLYLGHEVPDVRRFGYGRRFQGHALESLEVGDGPARSSSGLYPVMMSIPPLSVPAPREIISRPVAPALSHSPFRKIDPVSPDARAAI